MGPASAVSALLQLILSLPRNPVFFIAACRYQKNDVRNRLGSSSNKGDAGKGPKGELRRDRCKARTWRLRSFRTLAHPSYPAQVVVRAVTIRCTLQLQRAIA